jgi:long-chain acyl-CoA synthetase
MRQDDTLPKLLRRNYERWGDDLVAVRHKHLGIWQEFTWTAHYANVKRFALGLKSLGFEPGDKLGVIGDNEPEWFWAELACQSIGGISVGIFVDCVPDEVKYIVDHSEAVYVVTRDQEQTDKILSVRQQIPRLRKVIYWDPKGMWGYDDPFVTSFDRVQDLGDAYEREHLGHFEESIERGAGSDLAIICYTSGTTGLPKGAMVTHQNLMTTVRQWFEVEPWKAGDGYLSYVPLPWIAEQMFGVAGSLLSGATVNFPERPETVQNDIREIGPSMILYSSRMWESLSSMILNKIEDGSRIKRFLFNLFLPVGYKVSDMKMEKKEPGLVWRLLHALGDLLVLRPLRDKIGLKNTRAPYTGGSLISPGTFRLFRAIGVDIRQIYGSSEAGLCCCHRVEDVKFESIGTPLPGMQAMVSPEGELLWKGDCVFQGYFKNPEKTAEALVDGWFHTGDAAHIDGDGHIIYLDRMDDMMELGDGRKYSPQHIEGSLKFSPYIRDAIAVGGGRFPYVMALVQIDFEFVGKWAEKRHIPYTTFADLSQKPQVMDLVEEELRKLNQSLPEESRVKKFACLHKELDPDEEELTRTRKLRRDFVERKYHELLDAVARGESRFTASSEIKYRDGIRGVTATTVQIRELSEAREIP